MKIDQMSKFRQVMFFIAIALTALISDAMMIYTPVLNNLYEAYPADMNGVNLFVSLPAFVLVVSSLVVPPVMKRIGKKTTLIAASAVALATGVAMI